MKPIRHAYCALALCAALPFAAHAADDVRLPADRAGSLLNAFQVMCTADRTDFDHLSAQATAMRMQVLADDTQTSPTGETVRTKGWVGMLTTGPFALRTEQMSGAKGIATSCSVEGPVPDVDAFRGAVIQALRVDGSRAPEMIEGARVYYWDDYGGAGDSLVLRDMDRHAGHFVQVKRVRMIKAPAR